MIEQAILNALLQVLRIWWPLMIVVAILSSALTMAIGSVRWWWVRTWRGGALWAGARDDYEAEIRRKDEYIATMEHALHEARHAQYVGAVVRLIEGRK